MVRCATEPSVANAPTTTVLRCHNWANRSSYFCEPDYWRQSDVGANLVTDPINVRREDLGIIDGVRVWKVFNADTGECIGWDQQAVEDTEPAVE